MPEEAFERLRRLRGRAQPAVASVSSLPPMALLATFRDAGVLLALEKGTLHSMDPTGVVTPELSEAFHQHNAALLALVEEWSERAAMAEYEGGLTRQASEALAWQCVLGEVPL